MAGSDGSEEWGRQLRPSNKVEWEMNYIEKCDKLLGKTKK